MDPVTQALAVATAIVNLETAVFAAAPKDVQALVAGDSLKMLHNIAAFILTLQEKINAAVGAK